METLRRVGRLALLVVLLNPGSASAHGGLPISSGVLREAGSETMFIPVQYWGIWVGDGSGPWKWICEEAINAFRARKIVRSVDGTFYSTDARGITLSTDGGCTWSQVTGDLAARRVGSIAVDSDDGGVAWVTTDDLSSDADAGAPVNGLFVTRDHGATFQPVTSLEAQGRRFSSVLVAPSDPKRIYVTSKMANTPFTPTVHRSSDGAVSFEVLPLTWTLDGTAPYGLDVVAIDPRDPDVIYLRAFGNTGNNPMQALLRSIDGGATFGELYRVPGEMTPAGATRGIDGVAVDSTRGLVLVATSKGLLAGGDAGKAPTVTLTPIGGLSQSQCVDAHDGAIYVCSTNYGPDFKALARSDDGAQTFQSILSYQDTVGPVDCPPGTPAATTCPLVWTTYRDQLGITTGVDAGMGPKTEPDGCGCSVGAHQPRTPAFILLLLTTLLIGMRRLRQPWLR